MFGSSSAYEESKNPNEFNVAVQRHGTYGRFVTQENEIKSGTPIAVEVAFLISGTAVVWQYCEDWKIACAMVMTWMGARLLSAYEKEGTPGFGFFGNLLILMLSLIRHVSGEKMIQWLQEDEDKRMEQHLVTSRDKMEKMMGMKPKEEVEMIEEIKVKVRDGTELSVRLTFPKKTNMRTSTAASPRPSLAFYCHGGAFVGMNPRAMDSFTCEASKTMHAVVAAPYYRLAPEHKFPTAHEDCLDAFAAIVKLFRVRDEGSDKGLTQSHLAGICDMSKICIFGDSAGGNLAAHLSFCLSRPAVTDRSANQTKSPALHLPTGCSLKATLLFCPVVTPYSPTASHVRLSNGPLVGYGLITWMWNKYLRDPIAEAHHPTVNLLLDDDINFGNEEGWEEGEGRNCLPSTVVITAQFDPLCDEGEQLAAKLSSKMKEACPASSSCGVRERKQGKERRVFAARRLEAHCLYAPSTSAWAFKAGKALLNDEQVPDVPL